MQTTSDILDVDDDVIDLWLKDRGHLPYRRKQILGWLYSQLSTDFESMTTLPAGLRRELSQAFHVSGTEIATVRRSTDESAAKLLILLHDGQNIETVIMHYRYGVSACISSQVGCKMGCAFCASGACGFMRDLTAGEMIGQILAANRSLPEGQRVSSIVVMGMGEPLDNFDNLVRFIRLAHDEDRLGLSYRRITVSTSGLVPRIRQLSALKLPITLAVSLHAPTDEIRDRLVPINRAYPLQQLMGVVREYAQVTGRRVTFEYALIKDVNDTDECARRLAQLVSNLICHVNLIPLNPVEGVPFRRSDRVGEFAEVLDKEGVEVTVRRELGVEIDAACGQLRRRFAEP